MWMVLALGLVGCGPSGPTDMEKLRAENDAAEKAAAEAMADLEAHRQDAYADTLTLDLRQCAKGGSPTGIEAGRTDCEAAIRDACEMGNEGRLLVSVHVGDASELCGPVRPD